MYQGKIPTKFAIAFYRQDAFVGDRSRAALMTADVDIKRIQLSINGLVVREHIVDFGESMYLESYRRFTDWLGSTMTQFPIDNTQFAKGVSIFTFDMMERCPTTDCVDESLHTGFVDIYVQFGTVLPSEMVMVVYAISPDVIDISKERAVRYTRVIV